MSTIDRWLNWTPSQTPIIENSPEMEPSKPTKPTFEGFEGSVSMENPIIRVPEPDLAEPCGPVTRQSTGGPEALPPLGTLDEHGYASLTVDDLPELEQRLRLSGWKVERRVDTLFCWSRSGRKPRVQ